MKNWKNKICNKKKCGFGIEHLKGQKKETNFLWFVRKGAKREALLAPGGDGQGLAGSNTHTPMPCRAAAKSPQLLFSSAMECNMPHPNPFSPADKVGLLWMRSKGLTRVRCKWMQFQNPPMLIHVIGWASTKEENPYHICQTEILWRKMSTVWRNF